MVTRNRPKPHQFSDNLNREKSHLETRLANAPEGDERTVIRRKLYDIEAARTMSVWLSAKAG